MEKVEIRNWELKFIKIFRKIFLKNIGDTINLVLPLEKEGNNYFIYFPSFSNYSLADDSIQINALIVSKNEGLLQRDNSRNLEFRLKVLSIDKTGTYFMDDLEIVQGMTFTFPLELYGRSF